MNQKLAYILLNRMEQDISVASLQYRDRFVWPLVKYLLYRKLLFAGKESNSKPRKEPSKSNKLIKYWIQLYKFIYGYLHFHIQVSLGRLARRKSVLFVDVNKGAYVDLIKNKKYSRYIHPYLEFVKDFTSVRFLNPYVKRRESEAFYFVPELIRAAPYLEYRRTRRSIVNRFFIKKSTIANYHLLDDFLCRNGYSNLLSESQICNEADDIALYEAYWHRILSIEKYKAIFLSTCYGNQCLYGLVNVAKRLNIPTIEIQHGLCHTPMYLGWQNAPEKSFDFLPKYYWCWSKFDESVLRASRESSDAFEPILGGNYWFAKNIRERLTNLSTQRLQHIIQEKKPKKRILVTLQHSIPISEALINSIENSPSDWLWLIRFHPLDFRIPGYREKYRNAFKNQINVEYKHTTNGYLYEILREVDVHITHHSTVCIEAISFNVPSILLENEYTEPYKAFIDSGCFNTANNSKELICAIENAKVIPQTIARFFEMSVSDEAGRRLLNRFAI